MKIWRLFYTLWQRGQENRRRKKSFLLSALSFYVTKAVLVGPKWFWSDQINLVWPNWFGLDHDDLVTTKTNWSGPNVIHFGRKYQFGPDQFILVVSISFCQDQITMVKSKFGQTKTILDQPKLFWSHRRTRHTKLWWK